VFASDPAVLRIVQLQVRERAALLDQVDAGSTLVSKPGAPVMQSS
jgi:hypothetical protein